MSIRTDEERRQACAEIVSFLSSKGLRVPKRFGDVDRGDPLEIGGLERDAAGQVVVHASPNFFFDVHFIALMPNGKGFPYPIRINAKSALSDGVVICAVINRRIAIVRQHRFALGTETWEFPRGFPEPAQDAGRTTVDLADLRRVPLSVFTRELGEEVIQNAEPDRFINLGRVHENTSTHLCSPDHVYLELSVDEKALAKKLGGLEKLKVELWDLGQVEAEVGKKLTDAHTLACLALARNHLEKLRA